MATSVSKLKHSQIQATQEQLETFTLNFTLHLALLPKATSPLLLLKTLLRLVAQLVLPVLALLTIVSLV